GTIGLHLGHGETCSERLAGASPSVTEKCANRLGGRSYERTLGLRQVARAGALPGGFVMGRGRAIIAAEAPGATVATESARSLSPGDLFHGRYRVERCLRVGGMGRIYQVLDESTGRQRALKMMLSALVSDPKLRARFASEARITVGIESDHLI